MSSESWHAQPASTAFARLRTDPARGLDSGEITERRGRHGPNRLDQRGQTPWYRVLLRQFVNVLIAILAVAAAVSLAIGEPLDCAAILAILLLNGLLGFVQEWRAERALMALAANSALDIVLTLGAAGSVAAIDGLSLSTRAPKVNEPPKNTTCCVADASTAAGGDVSGVRRRRCASIR